MATRQGTDVRMTRPPGSFETVGWEPQQNAWWVFHPLRRLPGAKPVPRCAARAAGTLHDIGIYCINAARYLFRDEPEEVLAASGNTGERRFREVDEMTSATLRFPGGRLAQFITSFGSTGVMQYRVVGTKGDLEVLNAYDYDNDLSHRLTVNGKTREKTFPARDQFAPELIYFSDCVLRDREPEPSGEEGLIDVQIIRALYRSAETGRPVKLDLGDKRKRPTMKQEIRRPRVREPQLVKTRQPTAA